ncbi:Holliday junction resolvase RuvX [Actinosynnema sp. NPDC020468]|uniref:Holliday junction resolvase RuvX n=1 Tax=Actinosynnema sp. NPDC020468 TaxID=3154488 RepID=UPI00340C8A26
MSSADRAGVDDPGLGRRLGVDVGSVRVGVALSDPGAFLATPLVTLSRDEKTGRDLADLTGLVAEHDVVEVVVGLPRTLAGKHGPAAEAATTYATALAERVAPVPVRLHDERLTTVTASRVLAERGVRGKRQRAVVDQAAAVEILQSWLDARARYVARSADEDRAEGDGARS